MIPQLRTLRSGGRTTHHRRAAILVLTVACLLFTTAFLAFSMDLGYMVVTESELQNAADAAALAGAREIPNGRAAAVATAQLWAAKNTAAGQSVQVTDSQVELGMWDNKTAKFTVIPQGNPGSPTAIRVTCQRAAATGNPLQLFIGPMIGKPTTDLAASAVASLEADKCGLIVGIDSVIVDNGDIDSYDSSRGHYSEPTRRMNGNVCSDGPIYLRNNGHVLGDALPGRGFTVNLPDHVTGSTSPRAGPIRWAAIDVAGLSTNNNNDMIPSWAWSSGRLAIADGTVLTLPPGIYYLPDGFNVTGTSAIEITGPTRFVVGGTSNVAGRGIVNGTGRPGNLRIDGYGSTINFSGSSEFHADIYAPTTAVNLNGTADFYGAVFAKSISFNGNLTAIHADESLERDYASYRTRSSLKD